MAPLTRAARHVPGSASRPAPRPVILDPSLRLPTTCKLLANYAARTGRRPWVFCAPEADAAKREALESSGAVVYAIPEDGSLGLSVAALLCRLRECGIRSLMVEGGQRVISSFYAARDGDSRPVVDILIVTVAPTLVGPSGVGVSLDRSEKVFKTRGLVENADHSVLQTLNLQHVRSEILGIDTVVACRVVRDAASNSS